MVSDWIERFPLPDGVPDAVVNRQQLAVAFDTSENTIDAWRRAGMPVLSEGSNGQAYEFQLSACWAWRHGTQEEKAARKREADEAAAQLRMTFLGVDAEESRAALTPAQMKELAEAELKAMQVAERRGQLVRLEDLVGFLEGLMVEFRAALDGQPDWLEREFGLDGSQVERVVAYNDELLASLHARINGMDEVREAEDAAGGSRDRRLI